MRLLFSSVHCFLDPSGGAALCTRELLELLAGRGMDCRALTSGILDHERETSLDEVLASLELPAERCRAELTDGRSAEVLDLTAGGVRVTILPTASSRAERSPDARESAIFLDLADQVLDRFRPEVLLTYGGHPACFALMRRARARGIAVVFHLHNFGYNDRRAFADASAVLEIPTAREVAPWVSVLEKLWDDPEFEARHRALALAEAKRWEPATVAGQFERLFRSLGEGATPGRLRP